jgi:hypothetical protein
MGAHADRRTNDDDYLNFRETRTTGQRLFSPDVYRRLRAVKAAVDPDDVFQSNHPVTAAASSPSA